MLPTLSPLERQRVTEAVRIAGEGTKVKWRSFGYRLSYVAHGKEHLVLSAPNQRVYGSLCSQVYQFYISQSGGNDYGNDASTNAA